MECNLFDNITYFPCHWKPNRISCEISQNIDWQSWQLFTVFLDRVLKNTLNPISLVMFLHKNKSIFKVAIKNFLSFIFKRTPANKWYIKKYTRLQSRFYKSYKLSIRYPGTAVFRRSLYHSMICIREINNCLTFLSAGLPLTALRQSFHAALLPGQYGWV